MKKYYSEINIARAIGIILVVLGHSFPDASLGIMNGSKLYQFVINCIYSFHMPLFFLLSGFLITNQGLRQEIKKKAQRLLVPYFFYSILTLVLKMVFANYAYNQFEIKELWKIAIGVNPNGGLWFLWYLFVISLLFQLFTVKTKPVIFCIIIPLVLHVLATYIVPGFHIDILSRIFMYSIYFGGGIVLSRIWEKLLVFVKKCKILLICLVVVFYINMRFIPNYFLKDVIVAYVGIGMVLVLAVSICKYKNLRIYKYLDILGKYSYDIYLLSYFVQIPIRVILFTILDLPYETIIISMFSFGLLIPILLSKYIIRRSTVLKRILIGNWKNES